MGSPGSKSQGHHRSAGSKTRGRTIHSGRRPWVKHTHQPAPCKGALTGDPMNGDERWIMLESGSGRAEGGGDNGKLPILEQAIKLSGIVGSSRGLTVRYARDVRSLVGINITMVSRRP